MKKWIYLFVVVILLGGAGYYLKTSTSSSNDTATSSSTKSSSSSSSASSSSSSSIPKDQWKKSSENKPYPDVDKHPNMWIKVSKKHERVYLIDNGKVLYTMYCSTGTGKNDTPTGTYHIQAERGTHFYNSKSGEGANYWVSWKNHGEYLFHSVPVDENGNYIKSEAQQLGKKANSHGCVRLSVPDAKWMYENIKEGTKVVITND